MDKKNSVNKIKMMMKKCKKLNYRSLHIILGARGAKQIPLFYSLLTKGNLKDNSILWCVREITEEFIIKNKKNLDKEWVKQRLKTDINVESEHIAFPKPQYCSYNEILSAMHQQYKVIVLQDCEELTPGILASITENVKGGGIIIMLMTQQKSLEDFLSVHMDENRNSRFWKRFPNSLMSCPSCLILCDGLNILNSDVYFGNLQKIKALQNTSPLEDLQPLQSTHEADSVVQPLINLCNTVEQANLLIKFLHLLKKRTIPSTIAVSSQRGRGKSAALGLAVAGAIVLNYSNIFLSSLKYHGVNILFKFLFKGLDALGYKEDEDYDLIESVNPAFNKALIGINVFKDHPQAVRFILPSDVENKLEQAELVIVENAASIPLNLLKRLSGSHILFMSSTTNGCGGVGISLHERIMKNFPAAKSETSNQLFENICLAEPINYARGDAVEAWINRFLCFESVLIPHLTFGCPEPQACTLVYVSRESLFSSSNYSEKFLQQLMSLFFCCKREIEAGYLLRIADNPDYHLFCLLTPSSNSKGRPSEILCAILVHVEQKIPQNIVFTGTNLPKCEHQCFAEWEHLNDNLVQLFDCMQGVHILDIVTHPHYQRMGYGIRALQLLQEFYEGNWISLDEDHENKLLEGNRDKTIDGSMAESPPLLLQLTEKKPQKMHYFLVSYKLTSELLRFWKKAGFVPVYICQEKDHACEHTCFMLKSIDKEFDLKLEEFWRCFREYYFILLSSTCQDFSSSFALNILHSQINKRLLEKVLTKSDIDLYLKPRRMKSLEKYCLNLGDLHCILPCIPILSKLYFRNEFKDLQLPVVQEVILLSLGVQRKTVHEIAKDLSLPNPQVHGLLNRTIRKLTKYLTDIIEKTVEKSMIVPEVVMKPLAQDLDEELEEAAKKIEQQQIEDSEKLKSIDFSQYAIKGSEDDWEKALHSGRKTLVSIKSIKKRPEEVAFPEASHTTFKSKKKHFNKKRK